MLPTHYAQPDLDQIHTIIADAQGSTDYFADVLRREHIPHLSFSQVTTVEFCQKRYWLQYIESIDPDPIPDYFTKGKLLHQLIAETYSHSLITPDGEVEPSVEQIESQFQGDVRAHLHNAVSLHRQNLWQGCRVVAVEEPFAMLVDADLPPCVGVIDLILEKDGVFIMVDHKTGRGFYPQDHLQMAIYREYVQKKYGVTDCRFYYDQYRWVKNLNRIRKPAFQRTEVFYPEGAWEEALERIRRAYATMLQIHTLGQYRRGYACYLCPYKKMC